MPQQEAIEIEYKGFTVRYTSDPVDKGEYWTCWQLKLSADQLSKLQAKIDKIDLASRKFDSFQAIMFGDVYGMDKPEVVTVTSLDKDDKHAWIVAREGNSIRRRKVSLDRLFDLKDADVVAEIQACVADRLTIRNLEAALKARRQAIPTLTLDTIRAKTNLNQEEDN